MPTFAPRLTVVVVAWSAISGAAPLAAQGTPAMATIYLKEGGVIQGQILNDNDPNGVRIKSAKSGTIFLLKTVWIDSIVKPHAPPVAAPAPKPAAAVAVSAPVASVPAVSTPAPSAPLPPTPIVAAPVVDGLEPPPAATPATPATPANTPAAKATAAKPAKASSNAEKKPAKFSHWYVGGGGSAPTGAMGTGTDIGYTGMLAYAAGVGTMTQLRLGGSGNYWAQSSTDANFYDLAGTFDLLIGKRIPGFVAPYGLIGGVGGTRSSSPPPGFTGYARDPLYGARIGGGLNSRRIFVEVTYQKVWVAGTTSGYVPFVFGFRF